MQCSVHCATDEVDDDVLAPLRSPLGRHLAHVHDSLRTVGVHVEDGRVHDARHVRAVRRRAQEPRVRREPDLRCTASTTNVFIQRVTLFCGLKRELPTLV